MTTPTHWDVIVIGAGQTGAPLTARLAEAGSRVLLAERKYLGGTCVNYGCTPTKTMMASARAAHVARHARRLGVSVRDVRVDLGAVVDRKEALVRQWRDSVHERLARAGDRAVLRMGHARFVAERTIELDGERYTADAVVVDVGARPAVPPIDGLEAVPWLDNRTIMELRDLPDHVIVLGGGFIGCEFAQMFRRFGAAVTVIDIAGHLLPNQDPEISIPLEQVFRDEGIRLELGAGAAAVSADAERLRVSLKGGGTVAGSHLLVAVGRTPNTDDLGCEAAGVELDGRGFIVVDDGYRTSASGVYAAGDVTGEPQFTHNAWDDHRILYNILLDRDRRSRSGRIVPYAAFTDPQVAGVGLTERQAAEQGTAYEAATLPFGNIARAIETDERAGILKVLVDPTSERLLGAAIVGAEAGELIHIVAAVMAAGAPARVLVDMQFIHPTFAEGVQSLVMRLPRYALD